MQRIHQKIIRTLFSACAVSVLLCACNSPNTPQSKPDPAPRPSPSPTPPSTGGSGGGSGTGSGSHGGLQNNQGHRDGGGVQADEGGSTVPSGPTTVKVMVKSVKDNLDGHKKVEKTGGGDAFEGELEVTVNKAAIDAGFVEDTVAELAKELTGKTAVLADGAIYKFTEDDKGEKVVTAASLIGPSKTIYVSAFKAKVTVKVNSIAANAPAHHSAIGAPYTAAKEVTAPIAMSVSPSHYFDTVKLELAKAIKAGLTTANDIGPERYRFFKTTTTTPAVITDLLANQTPTIDVGTENLKVKAKVTLALAQAVTTAFAAGTLSGRTVAVPTDSEITNNTVIKEYKSMSEDWEVTADMMKEVGAAIKAAVGAAKIGTAAGKYAFFTTNSPTQASYISAELDAAGTLTKDNHHGKIIYIGLLK